MLNRAEGNSMRGDHYTINFFIVNIKKMISAALKVLVSLKEQLL